jgi:hypothetical protein
MFNFEQPISLSLASIDRGHSRDSALAMLLVEKGRTYPPETVAVMTAAFDQTCRFLPKSIAETDEVRRKLALLIIRYVDQGGRDPMRLQERAARELAGANA